MYPFFQMLWLFDCSGTAYLAATYLEDTGFDKTKKVYVVGSSGITQECIYKTDLVLIPLEALKYAKQLKIDKITRHKNQSWATRMISWKFHNCLLNLFSEFFQGKS